MSVDPLLHFVILMTGNASIPVTLLLARKRVARRHGHRYSLAAAVKASPAPPLRATAGVVIGTLGSALLLTWLAGNSYLWDVICGVMLGVVYMIVAPRVFRHYEES